MSHEQTFALDCELVPEVRRGRRRRRRKRRRRRRRITKNKSRVSVCEQ